jgi:hypothetical protein
MRNFFIMHLKHMFSIDIDAKYCEVKPAIATVLIVTPELETAGWGMTEAKGC